MTNEEIKELEFKYLNNIKIGLDNYKHLYDKGLQLIQSEPQPKDLLVDILDEYQNRLTEMPAIDLSVTKLDKLDDETKEKVKSLVLFGTQAALIKENASAQENLRRANSNYRDLLSVVTHEFKNSLTSIYGYNRIIKKRVHEGRTGNLEELSDNIDRLTRNLFGLVDTLFSMSLIEQGKLQVDPRVFDIIEDSIKPIMVELELRLQKKNMRLKIKSSQDKNIYYGDERFFQMIFRNLVQNATQYGKSDSEIKIDIERLNDELIIVVYNEGSGLDKEHLEQIFEKFSQFHESSDKSNVGIGLFTVKSIIELHKGVITAESEKDEWMRFIIRLPMEF